MSEIYLPSLTTLEVDNYLCFKLKLSSLSIVVAYDENDRPYSSIDTVCTCPILIHRNRLISHTPLYDLHISSVIYQWACQQTPSIIFVNDKLFVASAI